jgi:hypothetical protein
VGGWQDGPQVERDDQSLSTQRQAEQLNLGPFLPLHEAVPELPALASAPGATTPDAPPARRSAGAGGNVITVDFRARKPFHSGWNIDANCRGKHLQDFRSDHLRHVDGLNQLLKNRGADPLDTIVEPETSVLLSLVQVMTAIGSEATIASLVSSEQLTNSTYECSMALGFAKDVNSLLERNYDDEKRHLSTLQRMRQQELGTAAHGRSKGAKPSRPASQT